MEGSHYAGLIVYRIGSDIEFLLLNDSCSDRRHWTPPKGKVVAQEDERKCVFVRTSLGVACDAGSTD